MNKQSKGRKEKDYKEDYAEFWKDIVEKNGELDKDAVMRELSDYHFMLEQVPEVYCAVTGYHISKPNTYAFEVIQEFEAQNWNKGCVQDDVKEMIKSVANFDDLKEELKEYFEI